jgi:hypothetical protein
MGLSAGVFRRENIWSVPSSFGKDSSYEKLKPQDPWFGYNLDLWSDEDEAEAQAALVGDHYETGEKRLQQCVPVKKLGG